MSLRLDREVVDGSRAAGPGWQGRINDILTADQPVAGEFHMNVAIRKPMSVEQFPVWEEHREQRFEFDGIQPVAMIGGTAAHAGIQRTLQFSLAGRLRGKACRPFSSELKIAVAGSIRYPDAVVGSRRCLSALRPGGQRRRAGRSAERLDWQQGYSDGGFGLVSHCDAFCVATLITVNDGKFVVAPH